MPSQRNRWSQEELNAAALRLAPGKEMPSQDSENYTESLRESLGIPGGMVDERPQDPVGAVFPWARIEPRHQNPITAGLETTTKSLPTGGVSGRPTMTPNPNVARGPSTEESRNIANMVGNRNAPHDMVRHNEIGAAAEQVETARKSEEQIRLGWQEDRDKRRAIYDEARAVNPSLPPYPGSPSEPAQATAVAQGRPDTQNYNTRGDPVGGSFTGGSAQRFNEPAYRDPTFLAGKGQLPSETGRLSPQSMLQERAEVSKEQSGMRRQNNNMRRALRDAERLARKRKDPRASLMAAGIQDQAESMGIGVSGAMDYNAMQHVAATRVAQRRRQ